MISLKGYVIKHPKWSVFLWLILAGSIGCSRPDIKRYQNAEFLLGTQISITVFSTETDKAEQAIGRAFQKISELEVLLSKHKKDSDVTRLNTGQNSRVKVSPVTFEVIKKAVEFGRISKAAFDITVEPLIELWQEAEKKNLLPAENELRKVRDITGYTNIILHPESSEIGFKKSGMSVDLGGIAKGYIIDEAIKVLKSQGITQGLVDAGGDIYALGNNPKRGSWLIEIRDPLKPEQSLRHLEISDKAIATSGYYMRFYTIQDKRYSHIIDPRTGRPVQQNIASVTVIAPDVITADALATAISVLGPQPGLKLAESLPEVEALIITHADGKLAFLQSTGFPSE